MAQSNLPAGWYDDGHGTQRWWDGNSWTDHTAASYAAASPAPAAAAPKKLPVWPFAVGGGALALILLVAIVGGIAAAGARHNLTSADGDHSSSTTQAARTYTMPDLTGLSGDAAQSALAAAHIRGTDFVDTSGAPVDGDLSTWTVVSFAPTAAAKLNEGDTSSVVLKKSDVAVPTIAAGTNGSDASTALTSAGFVPSLKSTTGDVVILASAWVVVSVDPAGGTVLPAGSTVTVTVQRPQTTVTLNGPAGSTFTWSDSAGQIHQVQQAGPVVYTIDDGDLVNANVVSIRGGVTCRAVASDGSVVADNSAPGQTFVSCSSN